MQYTTGTTTQGGPDELLGLGKLSDLSKPVSLFCKMGVVRTRPQSAILTRVGSGISH